MSAPDPDIDRIADQILTDLDLEILDRDLADWLSRDPARRSVFIAELYRLASGIGDYWDHSFVNFCECATTSKDNVAHRSPSWS